MSSQEMYIVTIGDSRFYIQGTQQQINSLKGRMPRATIELVKIRSAGRATTTKLLRETYNQHFVGFKPFKDLRGYDDLPEDDDRLINSFLSDNRTITELNGVSIVLLRELLSLSEREIQGLPSRIGSKRVETICTDLEKSGYKLSDE